MKNITKLLALILIISLTACTENKNIDETTDTMENAETPETVEPVQEEVEKTEFVPASWEDGIIAYVTDRALVTQYTLTYSSTESYITSEEYRFVPFDRESDTAKAFFKIYPDKENAQLYACESRYGTGDWQDHSYGTESTIHSVIEFVDNGKSLKMTNYFTIADEGEEIDFKGEYSDHYTISMDYSKGEYYTWSCRQGEAVGWVIILPRDYVEQNIKLLHNKAGIRKVNIRTSPEIKDDNIVGVIGDNFHVGVYESVYDGTYTWYRFGEDLWVADNGEWFTLWR